MDIYVKTRISIRSVGKFLATAFIALFAALLFGCAGDVKFTLSAEEIRLYVGDTRDVKYYAQFPTSVDASARRITLSTNSDCVEIDGTKITAVKSGIAEVTFKVGSSTAKLLVYTEYRAANELIVTHGNLNQTAESAEQIKPIEFTAALDGFADPAVVIEWLVNGKSAGTGRSFVFAPNGYGEYDVCATAGALSETNTVKVFRQTTASAGYTGIINQTDGSFSAVRFVARENIDTRNPLSVYEWSVNGEACGYNAAFDFTPTASGEYTVTLSINGAAQKIAGADGITIIASGARAPRGEVYFDDEGGIYVKWADGEYINRVSIISPDSSRVNIDRSDAQNAYRFGRGTFNLDGLLSVCSNNQGDYKIILEAAGVSEFAFTPYPIEAQEYLDDVVLCRNRFISSDTDGRKFIAELYACGITASSCYIARGAESAVAAMQACADSLGLSVEIELSGSVATVELSNCVNAPTEYSSASAVRMYSSLPHIEYEARNRRAADYVLALDRIKKSVSVESSEQLLYAALSGVKPLPKDDSPAKSIYSAARNKLISIIGANYTEAQKVHAVYDWLQWTSVQISPCGKRESGRFLEGVFGSTEISAPSGGIRQETVDSEGMAKAFALLICMEGIPCIIQSMPNGDGLYFWNKVQLNGQWYNVDVYGGEISSDDLGLNGRELLSHRGLLFSDKVAEDFGLLPLGGEYEAFDDGMWAFLEKYTYNGVYFDYYIDRTEKDDYASIKAAVYRAFDGGERKSVTIPLVGRDEIFMNTTFGAEFELDGSLGASEFQSVVTAISRAANEYASDNYGDIFSDGATQIYIVGNCVHIIDVIPNVSHWEGA